MDNDQRLVSDKKMGELCLKTKRLLGPTTNKAQSTLRPRALVRDDDEKLSGLKCEAPDLPRGVTASEKCHICVCPEMGVQNFQQQEFHVSVMPVEALSNWVGRMVF